jgi:hypothetical protein
VIDTLSTATDIPLYAATNEARPNFPVIDAQRIFHNCPILRSADAVSWDQSIAKMTFWLLGSKA